MSMSGFVGRVCVAELRNGDEDGWERGRGNGGSDFFDVGREGHGHVGVEAQLLPLLADGFKKVFDGHVDLVSVWVGLIGGLGATAVAASELIPNVRWA